MGRMIGYMGNRSDRLREALLQEQDALRFVGQDRTVGWGVGFFQAGEVLHKKRPRIDERELDWHELANNVQTDCALIHVREATVGDHSAENTHPFRLRSWLFAHHGTIDRAAELRGDLVASMPDFLQRNIRGTTDSEIFFHMVMRYLHESGQLDSPDDDEKAVLQSLRFALERVQKAGAAFSAASPTLNCVLTNGRRMYALRYGAPMSYVMRTGLADQTRTEKMALDRSAASAYRYGIVVSRPEPETPAGYEPVGDHSVLILRRDLTREVVGL